MAHARQEATKRFRLPAGRFNTAMTGLSAGLLVRRGQITGRQHTYTYKGNLYMQTFHTGYAFKLSVHILGWPNVL